MIPYADTASRFPVNRASHEPPHFQSPPPSHGLPSATSKGTEGNEVLDPYDQPAKTAPPSHTADLIDKIRQTAEKLVNDHTSRGDLKILSRTLQELRYAFKVFSPYRSRRKVTVFGSARTPAHHPAYQQAVEFGAPWRSTIGWSLRARRAGSWRQGTSAQGGRSMGLNILLPFEQAANPVIADDPKLVHMKYFFTRKLMFVKESNAMCCLPGGFGTLDEGLEVLTLLQTGKRDMVPVVFLDPPGGDYWQNFQNFILKDLLGRGMLCPEDVALYRLTDKVEEAVEEILTFYRVYHSMRYVHHRLVLRLQQRPSDEVLDALHDHFADLLAEGRFTVSGPLEEELDDPSLARLPRLVFVFTRHNFGRLRQLIDFLNSGKLPPTRSGCPAKAEP